MDASRLRRGELIAAVSGVALLVVMFLPWFSITVEGVLDLGAGAARQAAEILEAQDPDYASSGVTSVGFNAWEVLSLMDLFFLVTALVAVALAVVTVASETVSVPVAAGTLTAALGGISALLILIRIIVPPVPYGIAPWIFLGLIAAAGVAVGGWMSMQDESPGGRVTRRRDADGFDDAF
ncbi:hypothetical protein HJD18_07235 [Thermoleophilia bacterium SCSIO 60948]|nr:hypothetical protein HJD18_07235 [Thermoleophilia bacterium SCSIO 60948]